LGICLGSLAFNLGFDIFDIHRFIIAAAHLGSHGETLDCSS